MNKVYGLYGISSSFHKTRESTIYSYDKGSTFSSVILRLFECWSDPPHRCPMRQSVLCEKLSRELSLACSRLPDSRKNENNCVGKRGKSEWGLGWTQAPTNFSHAFFLFPYHLGAWNRLIESDSVFSFWFVSRMNSIS